MKLRAMILFLGLLPALAGCVTWGGRGRPYLETIQGDLGEAARGFTSGRFSGQQYLAVTADRTGKARRFRDDPAWQSAAGKGDRDGDRVPDRLDRCPDTPRLTPTDEHGCPRQTPPDCDPHEPRCQSPGDDRRSRDLEEVVSLLFDPGCDGSPVPQTPQPLEWGRDTRGTPGTGFNLAVTRVDNQKPGCTLYYEMQFRIELSSPTPETRYVNVLFKEAEDLLRGDPRRAMFAIPMNMPLPPQRESLRDGLDHFPKVQWRVRAVNGAERISSWSSLRTQEPSSSGVTP